MTFENIAAYAVLCFGSLFAILNPLNTIPPFLAMTEENDAHQRIHMARRASSVAFGVMAAFALLGMAILNFFRISIPAFQVAGGLVILRVSFELLQGSRGLKVTVAETQEGLQKEDISITPLAVPILCGPGSITTAILLGSAAETWIHTVVLIASALVIYFGTFVLLRLAALHSHVFGETTLKITSRLMGLILISIAVQFILDGLREAELF